MMRMMRKCITAALALGVCLSLSGCMFNSRVEQLYRLPQLPVEYTELKNNIDKILNEGAEYAAPLSGTNIQPVQMVDLDGDGTEEAVVFFRKAEDEKPLKICIFRVDEESYELSAMVESSAASVYSISYTDMNDDGRLEMIIGWRINSTEQENLQALQALSVYTLRNFQPVELLQKTYARYVAMDMNGDGLKELVILRSDEESNCTADYYQWDPVELQLTSSARVSSSVANLSQAASRVVTGVLQDGKPALFITGVEESSIAITDVLTDREGDLVNITQSSATGISTEIFRFLSIYPQDIDRDGVTEVPVPMPLPTRGMDGSSVCYQVEWRSYSSDGTAKSEVRTCHNVEDGWYLLMPESWDDNILVTRSTNGSSETVVTFTRGGSLEAAPKDFLRIATIITGDGLVNSSTRAERFVLNGRQGMVYMAEILEEGAWEGSLTKEEMYERFYPIQPEWRVSDN